LIRSLALSVLFLPFAGYAQFQVSQELTAGWTPVGSTLDFASVATGNSLVLNLELTNTFADLVTINSLSIGGTGEVPFSLPGNFIFELPYALAPGRSWNFQVGFSPSSLGSFSATLQVNSSVVLTLTGTGSSPAGDGTYAPTILDQGVAVTSSNPIDFGRVQMGTSSTQTLTILNGNPGPITISTIAVAGNGFSGPSGITLPCTLAPNQSQTFQIAFAPVAPNAAAGSLTINQTTFPLAASGFLAPFPLVSITFDQNTTTSAQQRTAIISLNAPANADTSGNLTLTFQPAAASATGDSAIQFLSGNPTVAGVTIHKGDTSANFVFQTGTTAGAISFALTLDNGSRASKTLTIAPETVQVNLSTAVAETGQLVLSLTGYDNTHAASQMAFTFYDTKGNVVAPGTLKADASQAFSGYYSANPMAGGAFALRASFPVTGDVTQIKTVQVEIVNPAGTATLPMIKF
jgi:hypothetical protein